MAHDMVHIHVVTWVEGTGGNHPPVVLGAFPRDADASRCAGFT